MRNVFQKDKQPGPNNTGKALRLYKHQSDAIRVAVGGQNYVLTTGTASGKSLAYIVPIVNHVLRRGSRRGIQAIIVYPMNALANSQYGELKKFLYYGYPDDRPPVRFAQYTGQEKDAQRDAILADPPDILITNYVMLELILTRPAEKRLVEAARGLKFLVMDELHTYRGRQGADVAMLIRRVRDRIGDDNLQYVGTSATLAGAGTHDQQRVEVARVATKFFGAEVATRKRDRRDSSPCHRLGPDPRRRLRRETAAAHNCPRGSNPPTDYESFISDPLAIWIEANIGLRREDVTERLLRATPRSISGEGGAAVQLAAATSLPRDRCDKVLQEMLLTSFKARRIQTPDSRRSRSAYTSSSAAATPCMLRWNRSRRDSLPSTDSNLYLVTEAGFFCRWSSAGSAARNTTASVRQTLVRPARGF